MATRQCNMQQTVQLGQAQPSALSGIREQVKSTVSLLSLNWQFTQSKLAVYLAQTLSRRREALRRWWWEPSQTLTALCATDRGEVFTHRDVVIAHLVLTAVLVLIGIGGAL